MKPVFVQNQKLLRQSHALCLCLLTLLLSCCSGGESNGSIEIQADQLNVTMPDRIRQVQALDIETLEAVATVNGQQFELLRSGQQFSVSIDLASNSNVNVSILFRERLNDGGVLDLANYSSSLSVGIENQTLQVFDDEFNDSPFDNDNDQISNLVEREEGSDPFVFDTRPENRNIAISFALPRIINDPQVTQVIATIAGTPRAVTRIGNNFEISGVATTRSEVTVEVILLQRLTSGISLVLADATRTIASGVQAVTIDLSDDDFNFDRDQDGDGKTNIDELQNGTDPFAPD